MKLRLTQVDAFAARPFEGNPAAVCVVDSFPDERLMQNVAMEMNLAETAFLVNKGPSRFDLRWFTPESEVDLCGHATLASAHMLFERGFVSGVGPIFFDTRSGELRVRKMASGQLQMDFPAEPVDRPAPEASWLALLGEDVSFAGANRMDILVEVASEAALRSLRPDLNGIARLPARGLIVTSRSSSSGIDFVSRFFAPALAVPEDPVTGSAHCCLAPYWADKLGKKVMSAYQASRRGGRLDLEMKDDRVLLGGSAVTVMTAEMTVD